MSLVKDYRTRCDACGYVCVVSARTSKGARAAARKRGWRRIPGSAKVGRDICNRCTPNYSEAR